MCTEIDILAAYGGRWNRREWMGGKRSLMSNISVYTSIGFLRTLYNIYLLLPTPIYISAHIEISDGSRSRSAYVFYLLGS